MAAVARLHKNYQFRYVYRHGRVLTNELMMLTYCSAKGCETKVGVSVSKKNGKATVRNRVKRLMRESVRSLYPTFKKGFNVVLCASSKVDFSTGITLAEVSSAIKNLLTRADLLAPLTTRA